MYDFENVAKPLRMLEIGAIYGFVVEGTYKIKHHTPALNGRELSYKMVFQRHPSGNLCCQVQRGSQPAERFYGLPGDQCWNPVLENLKIFTGTAEPTDADCTIRHHEAGELINFG